MKKLLLITGLFIIPFLVFAQKDTVVKLNGNIIICKIQREDSLNVYLTLQKGGRNLNTYISKNDVKSLKYYKKSDVSAYELDKKTIGIGIGMDYGGIGGNFLVYPQRNVGLFVGAGYAMIGLGYNFGLKIRLIGANPTSRLSPYLIGMYGYNAAIMITNASEYDKFFYGLTLGFGLDLRSSPTKKGYWTIGVLFPLRGNGVDNYINDLKKNHGVQFKNELLPIGMSIGYRLDID